MSRPYTLAPASASANPLVALIVDGGRRSGFGHVGRSVAIWEELGGRAVFDVEDADVVRALRALGAPLGGDDTRAPVALIDRRAPTGAAQVRRLRAHGRRVCLLDDPGSGRLSADLVVDPPTGASWPAAGGRRLAGFEHALLRRDIRAAADASASADASVPTDASAPARQANVLLTLGGSDPEGLTPVLAGALVNAGVAVTSVLGPAYRGPRPAGRVLVDSPGWPRALGAATLLVARFGHTLLEAAHLGTPALAVAVSEQAMADAEAFAAHGTSEAIAIEGPGEVQRVLARVQALQRDTARLAAMARRGRKLVDGLGAARVADALRELA